MKEYVVGFTARPLPRKPAEEWPSPRRNQYLLVTDVPDPVSVDPAGVPALPCMTERCARALGMTALHPCVPVADVQSHPPQLASVPLWPFLPTLQQFLYSALGHPISGLYAILAITRLADAPLSRSYVGDFGRRADLVSCLDGEWTLLGYDVADAWLTSGLLNCAYDASARSALRRYQGGLNTHHLFQDRALAEEFVADTNRRVPEHAPFHVYGIYGNPGAP